VNIDHVQAMTTQEGPISWITSGKLDAVLDIKFPRDGLEDGDTLNVLIDALTTTAAAVVAERIPGQHTLAKPPLTAPDDSRVLSHQQGKQESRVVIDIDLRFRDLKAVVPIWTHDLSYSGNALIRPIVAFMK
jgi:mitochondrial distribution and morphology protein 31